MFNGTLFVVVMTMVVANVSSEKYSHIMHSIIDIHKKSIASRTDINLLDIYKSVLNNINLDNSQCKLIFENCLFRIDKKKVDISEICYPLHKAKTCLNDREAFNVANSECTYSTIKGYLVRHRLRLNSEIDACVKTYPLNYAFMYNSYQTLGIGFIHLYSFSLLFLIYFWRSLENKDYCWLRENNDLINCLMINYVHLQICVKPVGKGLFGSIKRGQYVEQNKFDR